MADTIIVHGIPNCDTIKKARKWLNANGISYEFHDYKKKGIDKTTLTTWCNELGYEAILNTRGTTWRTVSDEDKSNLSQTKAVTLMIDNTSMIKRPVITTGRELLVGFDEARYKEVFL